MDTSTTVLRWRDWISPTIAALISVIVNYGGTFILVFQAVFARLAELRRELKAYPAILCRTRTRITDRH